MKLPILSWLPGYQRRDLASDAVAGLTVGALAIPQSLSYAAIAGCPAVYGLYSDLQVMYPPLGTSRFLVVGPVAVMSLLIRVVLEREGEVELSESWASKARSYCVAVSAIQAFLAAFSAGPRMSSLLSEPAVQGFTAACALIIASTQLPALLGLSKCSGCGFFGGLWHLLSLATNVHAQTILVSLGCLGTLAWFRRAPGVLLSKLGPLFVLVLTISSVGMLTGGSGADAPVRVVGHIPSGLPLPSLPPLPTEAVAFVRQLVSALPIAFVGYAEALAIARSSAKRSGDTIDENQELWALAACNLFTGFVGGFPVSGSFSRTAVNFATGARTPLATAVAALAVMVALVAATRLLALLPVAAVAAIVVSCVLPLVDVREMRHLAARGGHEAAIYAAVFASSLAVSPEVGIAVGVGASALSARIVARLRRNDKLTGPPDCDAPC